LSSVSPLCVAPLPSPDLTNLTPHSRREAVKKGREKQEKKEKKKKRKKEMKEGKKGRKEKRKERRKERPTFCLTDRTTESQDIYIYR